MAPPKPLLLPLLLLVLLLACGAAAGGGSNSGNNKATTPAATSAASSSSSSSSSSFSNNIPAQPATSAAPPSSSNDWCGPGLECPRYDLLEVAGEYQVRKYEPAAWAVTVVRHAGSLQAAQIIGLARLARYWKGDNDRGRALPPTAPLVTALFPTKDGDAAWSAEGIFVVAAPLPPSEAHYPPRPSIQRWCPWGDPDARRGGEGCRVRVFRSGVEGGCRNWGGDDDNNAEASWLAEVVDALVTGDMGPAPSPDAPSQGGDDEDDGEDDPPCFLDGPNGDCSEEEEEGDGGDDDPDSPPSSSSSSSDDPNRRRKRRRHRAKGTVLYAGERFDGFPTERDALSRARALRLSLHADRRPYCRRVFFLAVYSPPWQLVLRRNEVWVPSCAKRRRRRNKPVVEVSAS